MLMLFSVAVHELSTWQISDGARLDWEGFHFFLFPIFYLSLVLDCGIFGLTV